MRRVYLDTETTGIRYDDQIINLGILSEDGEVLYNSLVKPVNKRVCAFITQLTGIRNEMLRNEKTFAEQFDGIVEVLKGSEIVAYNAGFDVRMLCQCADMIGRGNEMEQLTRNYVDLMKVYSDYVGLPRIAFKLEEACAIQKINVTQNHRAIDDCLILSMLEDSMKQPAPSFEEILTALQKIYQKKPSDLLGKKIMKLKEMIKNPKKAMTSQMKKDKAIEMYQKGEHRFEVIAQVIGTSPIFVQNVICDAYQEGLNIDIEEFLDSSVTEDILRYYKECPDNRVKTYIKEHLPEVSWITINATIAKGFKEGLLSTEMKPKKVHVEAAIEDIVRMFHEGHAMAEIAKCVGCKESNVEDKLVKAYERGVDVDLQRVYKAEFHEDVMRLVKECPDNRIRRYVKSKIPELSYFDINVIMAMDKRKPSIEHVIHECENKKQNHGMDVLKKELDDFERF